MKSIPEIGGRAVRLLVADDERDNRELMDVILAWEGFSVVTAAGGEEVLASVAAAPVDLILMDVMMPGMDGYQVTASLKAQLATKSIPVIIVTALADRGAREAGRNAGAEGFLAKPVDRDDLVVAVKDLLRKTYADYRDAEPGREE